jgi:hypothetical protein
VWGVRSWERGDDDLVRRRGGAMAGGVLVTDTS